MTTISHKKLEANRQNAKLGGVKTEEGKAISRLNAIKHGLLSKEVLLEKEDEENFVELGKRLRNEIKPVGEVEILLVDRITANIWRLRRALEVEKNAMEWWGNRSETDFNPFPETKNQNRKKRIKEMIVNSDTEKILRYENAIERGIYKALHELQRIQSARMGNKPPAPVAVDIDVSKDSDGFVS